eukprot:CFRG2839T1
MVVTISQLVSYLKMNPIMKTVFLALAVLVSVVCGQSLEGHQEKGARVLGMKSITNKLAVEGKDLTVLYSFYNIGDKVATDVTVDEPDVFPDWPLVAGIESGFKIPVIHPGTNISHALVYRLGAVGSYEIINSTVFSYKHGEKTVLSKTSAPGFVMVASKAEYERKYTLQLKQWFVYATGTILLVVFPYLGYQSSNQKSKLS